MNTDNIILATDGYKQGHWRMYPPDTEGVYSYFESREGARYPYTQFFGLQYLLKRYMVGNVVQWDDISEALKVTNAYFADNHFNYKGWAHIMERHGGRLPLRIKAVPEGMRVPTGNVLMTVENTDPECYWLTNAVESLLTHVWHPSLVATHSHEVIDMIAGWLERTADLSDGLPFMLHDFAYRSATSHETAAIGGAAHLINSMGTDTIPAMLYAMEYYGASLDGLAGSVPASEHSVMTARGREGEYDVVKQLLDDHPTGILSVVADSYNIYEFVYAMGERWYGRIMERDGTFVVRPDSTTPDDPIPAQLVLWIAKCLWDNFGGTVNSKGYKVLDPHVRILWGDGVPKSGIYDILHGLATNKFSAENMVFGMGSSLIQRDMDRDTQRNAFKASSILRRGGQWTAIYKDPIGSNKASKPGRLKLIHKSGTLVTVTEPGPRGYECHRDVLETVFEDGKLVKEYTFDEVRANALI
jgi:nicotinamide phosphoribosyltransferase